ncbi:MAG: dihydroneopterin aldolase [Lentisphaeria bacterium]|nr:dihydroneopterin aldolase [Lentisphaeria bacterium]
MDKIRIEAIAVQLVIGTLEHERVRRQQLLIDIEIGLDLKWAAESDDLTLSVDYSEIERRTVEIAENSSFYLLEALGGAIGKMLLSYDPVQYGRVSLFKAAASAAGKGVRVEMEFNK